MPRCQAIIDSSIFYQDPERYDLITGALSAGGPVDFYRAQARRYGGPILELAAGTGRLAIAIARDGAELTGLEASPRILSVAARKASASDLQITWARADMRNFDLDRKFQLTFIASNSLSHLYSRADVEACLARVRRHLAPSGRFLVEVFNPALGLFAHPAARRIPVGNYTQAGTQVEISKSVHYDSASQISHETWYFRDSATGQEESVPLNLRMFFPQELDALIHYNGLVIEQEYGDQEHRPFTSSSSKQILVCAAHPAGMRS